MSLLPPISRTNAKFDIPGKTYSGTLVEIGDEQQSSTYDPTGPGKPAFWDDEKTRPKMQRRFLIQCAPDPTIEGDDGSRGIYAVVDSKHGSMYAAIHEALKTASALGGTLKVTFTGTDPLSKNPANPRKLYSATYADPTPGQVLGGGQATAAQTAAGAAAPVAEAVDEGPPAGITAEAWAAMPPETRAAIAAAQAPPF